MTTPIPDPGADVDISVDPSAVEETAPGTEVPGGAPVLTTDAEAQLDDSLVAPESS